jgi:hypothetical protein
MNTNSEAAHSVEHYQVQQSNAELNEMNIKYRLTKADQCGV